MPRQAVRIADRCGAPPEGGWFQAAVRLRGQEGADDLGRGGQRRRAARGAVGRENAEVAGVTGSGALALLGQGEVARCARVGLRRADGFN